MYFAFWDRFLHLSDLLLSLIRADRDGDWMQLLALYHKLYCCNWPRQFMPKICFTSCIWNALSEKTPVVHDEFVHENLVVKLAHAKANQVRTDQLLEQSANRDAKRSGGIIRITMNEACLM